VYFNLRKINDVSTDIELVVNRFDKHRSFCVDRLKKNFINCSINCKLANYIIKYSTKTWVQNLSLVKILKILMLVLRKEFAFFAFMCL